MTDYGCDPLENGMFRMVPSGDIVNLEEMRKRLPEKKHANSDCLGKSWEQIAIMQGGLHTLDITRKKR